MQRKLGKKAYHLKPSKLKEMILADKYKYLQQEGKLKKYMEKRRKKNAAKDRKWLTN